MNINQILQPMNNNPSNSKTMKTNYNIKTSPSCFKHNTKATFVTMINQKAIGTCDPCAIELLKQGYRLNPIDDCNNQQSLYSQQQNQELFDEMNNVQYCLVSSLQQSESILSHYQLTLSHLCNTIKYLHSNQQQQLSQMNQLLKQQLNLSYQTQLRNINQYFNQLIQTIQHSQSKLESIQHKTTQLIEQSSLNTKTHQQHIIQNTQQLQMAYNQIRNSIDDNICQLFQINNRSKIQELNTKINIIIVDFIRQHIQELPLVKLAQDKLDLSNLFAINIDDNLSPYHSNNDDTNLDRNQSRVIASLLDNRQQINSGRVSRSPVSRSGSHQKARNQSNNSNGSSMIVNDKVIQEENYMEQKIIQTFKDNNQSQIIHKQQSQFIHNQQSHINSLQSFLKNQISPDPHQNCHKDLFNSRHLQELSANTPSPHFQNKKKI